MEKQTSKDAEAEGLEEGEEVPAHSESPPDIAGSPATPVEGHHDGDDKQRDPPPVQVNTAPVVQLINRCHNS